MGSDLMGEGQTPQHDEKEIRNVLSLPPLRVPEAHSSWGGLRTQSMGKCWRRSGNFRIYEGCCFSSELPSLSHPQGSLPSLPSRLDSDINSPPRLSLTTILKQHLPPHPCSPWPCVPVSCGELVTRRTTHSLVCSLFPPLKHKLHKGRTVLSWLYLHS